MCEQNYNIAAVGLCFAKLDNAELQEMCWKPLTLASQHWVLIKMLRSFSLKLHYQILIIRHIYNLIMQKKILFQFDECDVVWPMTNQPACIL